MKRLALAAILFAPAGLAANEVTLAEAAAAYYNAGEYYSAITEAKRWEFLYPQGELYPSMLLLKGKAMFYGGDTAGALNTMTTLAATFPHLPQGNEAAYLQGRMRLTHGAPVFALTFYNKYISFYGASLWTEEAERDICYGRAISLDFAGAKAGIAAYKAKYGDGKYVYALDELAADIAAEESRPTKSMAIAIAGSAVIPGFGYFYTGHYGLGVLAFLTNAILIAAVVDGIIRGNIFQWAFFGLMEVAFYKYSIEGAIRSVDEYNSRTPFAEKLRLSFEGRF